jgi:hypothetical protein
MKLLQSNPAHHHFFSSFLIFADLWEFLYLCMITIILAQIIVLYTFIYTPCLSDSVTLWNRIDGGLDEKNRDSMDSMDTMIFLTCDSMKRTISGSGSMDSTRFWQKSRWQTRWKKQRFDGLDGLDEMTRWDFAVTRYSVKIAEITRIIFLPIESLRQGVFMRHVY